MVRRFTTLIVLALLFGAVGTASVTSVAAAATPPTSDGALHLLPPLNNGPTGDPAQADSALLDSVDVRYCKVTTTGCTAIGEANSVLPGVDLLALLGGVYTTAFSGTAHGVNNGDTIRITVRVAGLSLGATQSTADIFALLPSATRFNPLVPLTVSFRIDRNPVIRTRYLHDHGASATAVAGVLKSQFGLDDATAATVLYDDLRIGDVSTMARTAAAVAPAVPNRAPYGVQDLVDAVSAGSTYGDNATRTAQVLVGRFANQDIVDALGASPNLNANAAQLLDAIQNGLGVTDPQQQVDLLANAKLSNGSPMLTPEQVLAAEVAKNGPLTPVQALTSLYNAGYAAGPSMAALQTVEGTGAVDMAAGALQVFGFPISDVTTALGTLYPGSDPATLLTQGGQQNVSQNCATYGLASSASTVAAILVRAGYSPAAAAALVNSACGFSATQAGTILAAPASGNSPTYALAAVPVVAALSPVYDPTGVAQALSTVYYPGEPGPKRATDIGQTLANGWRGPNPLGVVDLLGGVGHAIHDLGQPGGPVECLASLGAIGGNNSLLDVLRHLDDPSLGGLLPNPFSTGANGNLAQLGACLITNGIKVPFPLKKITVNEQGVQLSATSLPVPNGVVATRAGWLPTLPGPHIAALNIATLPVFGSAPQNMQGGAYGCIQSICDQHHNLADLAPFAGLKTADPFTMIVPALPGNVLLEGTYWTAPAFSCSTTPDPAAVAAAIALPFTAYTAIPGGTSDWILHGTDTRPATDGTNSYDTGLGAAGDNCGRATDESGDLYSSVQVQGVGNVTDALQAANLGPTLVNLTGAENVGGHDFDIANVSALANLSQIESVAGNFLSLLGEGGVTPSSGTALANLLQTGNG